MTDAALGSTATVSPGLLPGTVSAMRLSATVRRLAGDEFTGRRVGTVGGRAAGAFLAEELRNVGAQVTVEEFRVGYLRDVYATPTFVWTDEAGQVRVLEHRRDFAEHLTSADLPAPRDGALVTAGAADWAVRWVLADGLDPRLRRMPSNRARPGCWSRAAPTRPGGCRRCSPAGRPWRCRWCRCAPTCIRP